MRNVFLLAATSSSSAGQKRCGQNNIIKYLFIYDFGQQLLQRFECNNFGALAFRSFNFNQAKKLSES